MIKVEQQNDEKERKLKFKIITPILSYGADNSSPRSVPEIRPTSIKGMMRYMFRIAQPTLGVEELLDFENKIFGDAKNKASPVRLAVVEQAQPDFKPSQFLQHKKKGEKTSISHNKNFAIRMILRPNHLQDLKYLNELKGKQPHELNEDELKKFEKLKAENLKGLNWYEELLEISFLLIGLGLRSRKGRGRSCNKVYQSEEDLKCNVFKMLQAISETADYRFEKDKDRIVFNGKSNVKRPFIEKIVFGKAKEKTWQKFFKSLDWASHDIKDASNKENYYKDAIKSSMIEKDKHQFRRNSRERNWKFHATGDSSPPFASSIIVGCAQIGKKILPIYTYVRPALFVEEKLMKNGKEVKIPHLCRLDANNELSTFIEKFEMRWNS